MSAREIHSQGVDHFFAGRIPESLQSWDKELTKAPQRAPHHWQRGLALYYAKKFQEGVQQFEDHQKVNSQDVENAVWHFLCLIKSPDGSLEKARKQFIGIQKDTRVPMKEIHALFAGTGDKKAVLNAAQKAPPGSEILRNQLCYAHLYLGLYAEVMNQEKEAKHHILLAAETYRMNHYMGKVAQVHAQLRGWKSQKKEALQP